ncbi:MAG: hypothetical protein ABR87_05350 [Cryomorphaceae bacterium BACL7 MAG-121220-bin83]|jgi:phage shock protein PspC (stress-responsive transcriptional regulator)|nr:MAG: hypothetical protein ABR87_05350 [Cryomorphaceae bacterium BACL7 MAG-121220-bin83]
MKKTIDIHLGGLLFHLDEDAYDRIFAYLEAVKQRLKNEEGYDEMLRDIESRLAELFFASLHPGKQVISIHEVTSAMETLGRPEDFSENSHQNEPIADTTEASVSSGKAMKRLFRDVENGFVGGVSGGLGSYFQLDPIIFRVLFLVLFFGSGIGLIAYFILWVAIPGAKSTAQKLAMRGEEVNIENIKKSVEEEAQRMKARFQEGIHEVAPAARHAAQGMGQATHQILKGLGRALSSLLRIIGFIFLLGLGAAGIALTVIGTFGFSWHGEAESGNVMDLFLTILPSDMASSIFWLATGTLVLGLLIEIVALILRFTFRAKITPYAWRLIHGIAILSAMVGVIIWVFIGLRTGLEFRQEAYYMRSLELKEPQSHFVLAMSSQRLPHERNPWQTHGKAKMGNAEEEGTWSTDGNEIYFEGIALDIKQSLRNVPSMEVLIEAHSGNRRTARLKASRVEYSLEVRQDSLLVGDVIHFPFEDRFRGQNVRFTLYLPIGHKVYLDQSLLGYLDHVDNLQNVYGPKMVGKYWLMTERGLRLWEGSIR